MHFLFSTRFTFIWPFCFLCKSTNTSWVERASRVRWPDQLFEIFSSLHAKPMPVFPPQSLFYGCRELKSSIWLRRKRNVAHVLLETALSVLDKSFSSPARHPHERPAASRFAWGPEVDWGNGGNQAWSRCLFPAKHQGEKWTHTEQSVRGWLWYSSHPCRPVSYEAEPETTEARLL